MLDKLRPSCSRDFFSELTIVRVLVLVVFLTAETKYLTEWYIRGKTFVSHGSEDSVYHSGEGTVALGASLM